MADWHQQQPSDLHDSKTLLVGLLDSFTIHVRLGFWEWHELKMAAGLFYGCFHMTVITRPGDTRIYMTTSGTEPADDAAAVWQLPLCNVIPNLAS